MKENITEYKCEFEIEPSKDQIKKLISEMRGLKFSYNGNLTVFIPRDAIFSLLEKLVNS